MRHELLNPGHVKKSGRSLGTLPLLSSYNSLGLQNEGEVEMAGGQERRGVEEKRTGHLARSGKWMVPSESYWIHARMRCLEY